MDANGTANTLNARVQPTIRSFFRPRQPSYTAPPSLPVTKSDPSPPPISISQTPPSAPQIPPKPSSPLPQQAISSSSQPLPQASTRSSTLPQQATISHVLEHHIQPLRRINSLLLPIHYPDSFYHKALTPDHPISFSRTILWTSTSPTETKVIGGIICRLDPALSPLSTPQNPQFVERTYDIYIQSLALLSPYRSKGLAAEVLQEIIDAAIGQNELRVASLYAHVWTESEDALTWYAARAFKREEPVLHGYYRRLKPDTAWILRRRLMPTDHLLNLASQVPQASPTPQQASSASPSPAIRPGNSPSARSFQERGPDREWNDLPEDVFGSALLKPHSHLGSREGSAASSRSSSRSGIEGKGKKKRVYPAAAFGS
jgi:GNAT superfamily N-acetyltransferase